VITFGSEHLIFLVLIVLVFWWATA